MLELRGDEGGVRLTSVALMVAPIGEGRDDLVGDQRIMGAAQHQSIDRRGLVGGGRLQERADVGADDVADRRLDRRIAFDGGGEGGRAQLTDGTGGHLGERLGIGVGGASAHGGEHGHAALRAIGGLSQALRAGFDDPDHDDG